jgi:AraC-like DNA-binding protein
VLLRRAMELIDANVTRDIGLADIADAVHVTPRAHHDLRAADRMRDTVTAIAGRWGFMHTGRFAVLYRQTYGQSPHTPLRDDPAGAQLPPSSPVRTDESMALSLRTLWAYRGFGGDLTRTAAALAVHRSTVRYRLHRIRT